MKVIGKTESGFILSAEKNEIANLIGYYSGYSEGLPKLSVGSEIDVHSMYQQLYVLSAHNKSIKDVQKKLSDIVSGLDEVKPVISTVSGNND